MVNQVNQVNLRNIVKRETEQFILNFLFLKPEKLQQYL